MATSLQGEPEVGVPTVGISPEGIQAKLEQHLGAEYVEVVDMSGGCGQAFSALIVSKAFEGKNMLARHRLVNGVLKLEIAEIHAWTPRCLTPGQWAAVKGAK
ncbi:hypothetical protein KEM55_002898 [Ascosphaera atra]|nr:hypothetical protein KEM55_002898 [Ascosphaera atra]